MEGGAKTPQIAKTEAVERAFSPQPYLFYLQNRPPTPEYSELIAFSVACEPHLFVHPEKEASFYPI
jgi:hypothetical protein